MISAHAIASVAHHPSKKLKKSQVEGPTSWPVLDTGHAARLQIASNITMEAKFPRSCAAWQDGRVHAATKIVATGRRKCAVVVQKLRLTATTPATYQSRNHRSDSERSGRGPLQERVHRTTPLRAL